MHKAPIAIAALSFLLTACSSSSITCEGDETKTALIDIVKENPPEQMLQFAIQDLWDAAIQYETDKHQEAQLQYNQCVAPEQQKFNQTGFRTGCLLTAMQFLNRDVLLEQCREAEKPYLQAQQRCNAAASKIITQATDAKLREQSFLTESKKNAEYWVDEIRVREQNKDTGALVCAASLHAKVTDRGQGAVRQIVYDVERTTDGKIFVSISPLFLR